MEEPNQPPGPKPSRDEQAAREWSRQMSLAIEFLGFLLVMGYAGWWVDQHYGWNGRGLFWGLILGLAAWIYRVLRLTWRYFK